MPLWFFVNRHLLVLSILFLALGGLAALRSLPRLEDPVITHRNPSVITPFPGATAEEAL